MPKETLREKATKKLDANPSQLGDPVSLKAETSDTVTAVPEEGGAVPDTRTQPSSSSSSTTTFSSSSSSREQGHEDDGSASGGGETLREKALKKNPTQLGDPTSLKAETSEGVPVEREKGAGKGEREDVRVRGKGKGRGSKL
ncbi:hypothetical protein F5Y17DRAFT_39062 [Xylariaceae sp. FL0594]|nr:hypothetical protein F5Y17DRAFT_39062 [Xylariaceae sp. FL0594]